MEENPVTRTTRRIAFALMSLYAFCLIATLGTAIYFIAVEGNSGEKWLGTFKDGFAFLAGALATIIGYYFGNRNTEVAFETARKATEQTKQAEATTQAVTQALRETGTSDDPINSTVPPVIGEGLQLPRSE
jgi:hypothetical protein